MDPMKYALELLDDLVSSLNSFHWTRMAEFPSHELRRELIKDMVSFEGSAMPDWKIFVTSWDEGLHTLGEPSGKRRYDGTCSKGGTLVHLPPHVAMKVFEHVERNLVA